MFCLEARDHIESTPEHDRKELQVPRCRTVADLCCDMQCLTCCAHHCLGRPHCDQRPAGDPQSEEIVGRCARQEALTFLPPLPKINSMYMLHFLNGSVEISWKGRSVHRDTVVYQRLDQLAVGAWQKCDVLGPRLVGSSKSLAASPGALPGNPFVAVLIVTRGVRPTFVCSVACKAHSCVAGAAVGRYGCSSPVHDVIGESIPRKRITLEACAR